ncbi:MAG: PAS domain-containing protein [Clostridia bacterium]|nr:PAS domain-containing protein [Clostridia bacterium]
MRIGEHLYLSNDVFVRRNVLDLLPCPLIVWDRNGEIVDCNPAGRAFLEAAGEAVRAVCRPQVEAALRGQWPPSASVVNADPLPSAVELVTRTVWSLDGHPVAAATAAVTPRAGWSGFWVDVLTGVAEVLEAAVLCLDGGGTVVACTRTVRDLLGERPEAVVGRDAGDVLVRPEGLSAWVRRAVAEGKPYDVFLSEGEAGGVREVPAAAGLRVQFRPLRSRGPGVPTLVVLSRLPVPVPRAGTEQRLSTLMTRVLHEIRNPLTSARGYLQMLDRRLQDDADRKCLAAALREVERISEVSRNLLEMARIGRRVREPVDLSRLAAEVLAAESQRAVAAGVEVRSDCPSGLLVLGDPRELKDAIANLVRNALEAMPNGGTMTVRCQDDPANGRCHLEVADTGTGIPEELLNRIFEPFFTTRESGTGLGLFLSREVVTEHGGSIAVRSEPGAGSVFRMTLPRLAGGDHGGA